MKEKKLNPKSGETQNKKLIELFEISDIDNKSEEKKLKINYNEKVFFRPTQQNNNNDEIKKLIDVLNQRGENVPINFNLNINNNFYNSNYNYVFNQNNNNIQSKEQKGEQIDYIPKFEKRDQEIITHKEQENEDFDKISGMTAFSLSIFN